jgi:hypothetical protein
MIDKVKLTKDILSQLSMPTDAKTIGKYSKTWWRNTRPGHPNSLRLSDAGFNVFIEHLNLTRYEIDMPKDTEWTSQLVLRLDNFMESPYYIQKKTMTVFREKTAIELILYGGDVQKYTWAKDQSQKNNTNQTT